MKRNTVFETSFALTSLDIQVDELSETILAMRLEIENLERKMLELELQGLTYAVPHWRKSKYLVLIYPQINGSRQNPDYVGSNSAKIAGALAAIARASKFEFYNREKSKHLRTIQDAQQLIAQLNDTLANVTRKLENLEASATKWVQGATRFGLPT